MPGPIEASVGNPRIELPPTIPEQGGFEAPGRAEDEFLEAPDEGEAPKKGGVEGAPTASAPSQVSAPVVKDEVTVEVEKILEDGLGSFYATLPPSAKVMFKQKGELAATEISVMVRSFNINFKRALQLVRDWLLTIPGVNRFFLEQEAKIKVDRIRELVEARKEEKEQRP